MEWDIVENATSEQTPEQEGQTGGSIEIDWDLSFDVDVDVSSVPTTDAALFSRETKSASSSSTAPPPSSSSGVGVDGHTTGVDVEGRITTDDAAPCRSCSDVILDPLRREALGNNLRELQAFLRQRLLARQDSDMSQPEPEPRTRTPNPNPNPNP